MISSQLWTKPGFLRRTALQKSWFSPELRAEKSWYSPGRSSSHLQSLGSHLLGQPLAATCKWLQDGNSKCAPPASSMCILQNVGPLPSYQMLFRCCIYSLPSDAKISTYMGFPHHSGKKLRWSEIVEMVMWLDWNMISSCWHVLGQNDMSSSTPRFVTLDIGLTPKIPPIKQITHPRAACAGSWAHACWGQCTKTAHLLGKRTHFARVGGKMFCLGVGAACQVDMGSSGHIFSRRSFHKRLRLVG